MHEKLSGIGPRIYIDRGNFSPIEIKNSEKLVGPSFSRTRENSARSRSIDISSFRGGGQPEDRKLIDTFTAISRRIVAYPRIPFLLFPLFSSLSFPPFFFSFPFN